MSKTSTLPTHLGFIVDGNRRWARQRGLPTLEGHKRGFKRVEMVVKELAAIGIPYMSFYLFSTENWNRSPEEVSYLMDLIRSNIKSLVKTLQKLDLRCAILGTDTRVAPDILASLAKAEQDTANNTSGTVCICFNYGGHQEIADAVTSLLKEPNLPTTITPELVAAHLYHPEVPPVDMVVRTSGEQRISNFMLWRSAYSEFLFIKKNFPAITKKDVSKIIEEFQNRHRRFGH